jgi:hypothetical protein
MNTHADKTQENKSQSVSAADSQMQSGGESMLQFEDNRPEAIAQRKLQEMANNSPQALQLKAFQYMANNSPQAKQTAQLQSMADNHSSQQQNPIQKKENNTGLPDNLKTGMENLSGYSMNGVKVHYNSDKPAQLQAHAYAQGTDIHVAPGQEKHLPHEAWHVVQQKQGRVKSTMQMKGSVNVNDDAHLEKEADIMGAKALQLKSNSREKFPTFNSSIFNNTVAQLFSDDELTKLMAYHPAPDHEQIEDLDRFTLDEISKLRHHLDWEQMVLLSGMRRSADDLLALLYSDPQPTGPQIRDIEPFSTDQLQELKRFGTSWDDIVVLAGLNRSPQDIVNLFSITLGNQPPALQDFINLGNFSNAYILQMIDLGEVNNWANLFLSSQKQVQPIEVAGDSQQFFDEQSALMDRLNHGFHKHIQTNPGRPLRIATFEFVRGEDGSLITNAVLKPIEALVAPFIDPVFLNANGGDALIPDVATNVKKTLFNAGQFQWIAANWDSISDTHTIYIDVDYYPNRMADAGGSLHKDSVGETLFVNLTYNNAEAGASAEYLVDNDPYSPFEDGMPQVAKDVIAEKRGENAHDDGRIKGVQLPQRGRTSFIDPAIWHATPFYNHRIPDLPIGDDQRGSIRQIIDIVKTDHNLNPRQRVNALEVLASQNSERVMTGAEVKLILPQYQGQDEVQVSVQQLIDMIKKAPELSPEQRTSALEPLANLNSERLLTGAEAKDIFRQREPLRFATRAGVDELVDTAPRGRRERARSVDLTDHPEHMEPLKKQSGEARSFIRTWVILRRK